MGQPLRVLIGSQGPIGCLVRMPCGRLASAAEDGVVRVWEVDFRPGSSDREPRDLSKKGMDDGSFFTSHVELKEHTKQIEGLCILPDGRLVSSSHDKKICIWEKVSISNKKKDQSFLKGLKSTDQAIQWRLDQCLVSPDGSEVHKVAALKDGSILCGTRGGVLTLYQ